MTNEYRKGYYDAIDYGKSSALWVIRHELKHTIKDVEICNYTRVTRVKGMLSGFFVAGFITHHEYDFYSHILTRITNL